MSDIVERRPRRPHRRPTASSAAVRLRTWLLAIRPDHAPRGRVGRRGGPRRRARGRRPVPARHRPRAASPSPSCSRSWPTSPTTSPTTGKGADTPDRAGPHAGRRRRPRHRAPARGRDRRRHRARRARRPVARPRRRRACSSSSGRSRSWPRSRTPAARSRTATAPSARSSSSSSSGSSPWSARRTSRRCALEPLFVVAAIPPGALITAILVVNNLRDIPTDTAAGKRTLAVVLGRERTAVEYALLLAVAYAVPALMLLQLAAEDGRAPGSWP